MKNITETNITECSLECTYYCSPDPQEFPDGTCSWCGDTECEELAGWDDVWLCKKCKTEERIIRIRN